MSEWVVPIAMCLLSAGMGWWFGAQIGFFNTKKKIKAARDSQYGELKKLFDLTNNRAKITTEELTSFIQYVNTDLPKDIVNITISEPKLLILKEKSGIPDKQYLEAFEPVIVNIQNTIAERLNVTLTNIAAETIKDIKGLMNDSLQEK